MNSKDQYPEFKDLTEADFNAIVSEYHTQVEIVAQRSEQIKALEKEHEEAEKVIAALRKTKAYRDEKNKVK